MQPVQSDTLNVDRSSKNEVDKVVFLHLIYLRYAMLHSGKERCVDRIALSRAARESEFGMDAKQAAELLHGLPLSSGIANAVFQEAVSRYESEYETGRQRQKFFDAERRQAILTAKCRCESVTFDSLRSSVDLPAGVFETDVIPEEACQKALLSVGNSIVRLGKSPNWLVPGWIPAELSKVNRPEIDELLPLPERSLSESEWLTVFWAIAKTNRREDLEKLNKIPDSSAKAKCDTPFDKLKYRFLYQKRVGDLERFKVEGRDKVITALRCECFRRLLPRDEPTSQSQIGFIGTNSDSERPTFLGTKWHSPHFPITDTREAIAVWLACTHRMMERWSQSFDGLDCSQPRIDKVSQLMACWVYDDAQSLNSRHGTSAEPLSDPSDFSEVFQYLGHLGEEMPEHVVGTTVTNASVDDRALAVLVLHQDWTNVQIAAEVDTNPKYLSSEHCPKFKAAKEAIRASSIPYGSKGKDGTIEAIGDGLDFDAMDGRMKNKR